MTVFILPAAGLQIGVTVGALGVTFKDKVELGINSTKHYTRDTCSDTTCSKRRKKYARKTTYPFCVRKNKWRSPTAERIYKNDERIEVRSAGMSGKSRHTISNDDIVWADLILVMESGYKSHILELFRDLSLPKIENLDIPDKYEYMDDKLIKLIENRVEYYIEKLEKQVSLP